MSEKSITVILGFGATGQSVARHLHRQQQAFAVLDTRPDPGVETETFGPDVEFHWACDQWPTMLLARTVQVVVSPGLSPNQPLVQQALNAQLPMLTDIDLFMASIEVPVIGVTGTNGKSTVVSLVGHLLNSHGLSCAVGGNLGPPALDLLGAKPEICVLELSSFQLAYSGDLDLASAAVLNIDDDHIDWHGSAENYANAKRRIYTRAAYRVGNRHIQQLGDLEFAAHVGLEPSPVPHGWGLISDKGEEWVVYENALLIRVRDLPISGRHNVENCLWALALVSPWIPPEQSVEYLQGFAGLPHRFAAVRGPSYLRCINDSKATNVGATLAALAGFARDESLLLIAGGDSKGADLSPLGPAMCGRVRQLYTLGIDAPRLNAVAKGQNIPCCPAQSMDQAVAMAMQEARQGDTLLLSPACASLDMYNNFAQRGDHFAALVGQYVDGDSRGGANERA